MSFEMYADRAELYDVIYDWKDYETESEALRELLRDRGVEDGSRVLEAACGTGNYLRYLEQWYDVAGFDLSPEMIEIADGKLGTDDLFVADMEEFVADEPFDAVVCLFSSIGYVQGTEALEETFANFYRSLGPGGVVVVEPWVTPENFEEGRPAMHASESEDLQLCRQCVGRGEGRVSVLDFHWLVARRDDGVEHFTDRHEMYMFTREEYLDAFDRAGFDAEFVEGGPMGRGWCVARR